MVLTCALVSGSSNASVAVGVPPTPPAAAATFTAPCITFLAVVNRLQRGGQVVAAVTGDPSLGAAQPAHLRRMPTLHGEDRHGRVKRGLVRGEHGDLAEVGAYAEVF